MNFLAHLWIADQTNTSLAGAVLADFVRGSLQAWPQALKKGMMLHRFIDKTMDSDELVLNLKAEFKPKHRRVAGICLDMAFDHQLAKHWSCYHSKSLGEFSQACYQAILSTQGLPKNALPTFENMAQYDWLCAYQDAKVIEHALSRIALRLSNPEKLIAASDEIWRLEKQIESSFPLLLAKIKQQASNFCFGDKIK